MQRHGQPGRRHARRAKRTWGDCQPVCSRACATAAAFAATCCTRGISCGSLRPAPDTACSSWGREGVASQMVRAGGGEVHTPAEPERTHAPDAISCLICTMITSARRSSAVPI